MPHIIMEYAEDLERRLDIQELLVNMHHALASIESFVLKDIKSRAVAYDIYQVGSTTPGATFVHVQLLLMPDRLDELVQRAVHSLANLIESACPSTTEITLEVRELRREFYYKRIGRPDGETWKP